MFQRLTSKKFFQNTPFYDRDRYDNIMQDPESPLGKKLSRFIMFCIFVSVFLLMLETVGNY